MMPLSPRISRKEMRCWVTVQLASHPVMPDPHSNPRLEGTPDKVYLVVDGVAGTIATTAPSGRFFVHSAHRTPP